MKNQQGKFIVVEGIDGSGKTTTCKLLKDILEQDFNISVLLTREPGGTEFGEKCRELLFNHDNLTVETEVLLMLAARFQHYYEKILPALENGTWVICDRWHPSTYVYQMWLRERIPIECFYNLLKTISFNLTKMMLGNSYLEPDKYIIMETDFKSATERLSNKLDKNRLDNFTENEFFKINYGYSYFKDSSSSIITNTSETTIETLNDKLKQFLNEEIDLK